MVVVVDVDEVSSSVDDVGATVDVSKEVVPGALVVSSAVVVVVVVVVDVEEVSSSLVDVSTTVDVLKVVV